MKDDFFLFIALIFVFSVFVFIYARFFVPDVSRLEYRVNTIYTHSFEDAEKFADLLENPDYIMVERDPQGYYEKLRQEVKDNQ